MWDYRSGRRWSPSRLMKTISPSSPPIQTLLPCCMTGVLASKRSGSQQTCMVISPRLTHRPLSSRSSRVMGNCGEAGRYGDDPKAGRGILSNVAASRYTVIPPDSRINDDESVENDTCFHGPSVGEGCILVRILVPAFASQMRTVLSSDVETRRRPSEENAMEYTLLACPSSNRNTPIIVMSKMRTLRPEAEAR